MSFLQSPSLPRDPVHALTQAAPGAGVKTASYCLSGRPALGETEPKQTSLATVQCL